MLYKPMYSRHLGYNKPVDDQDVIRHIVDDAIDPERGGLVEDTDARLRELVSIVGVMFSHLPDRTKREIAEHFGWTARED